MMTKSTHGGARPNSGRKPVSPLGLLEITVTLPPDLLAVAGTLGDGNVSEGVRRALAHFAEQAGPSRELQVWAHKPTGQHYLIIWQGALIAAAGPMSLEQAQAMQSGAAPQPAKYDPAVTDWADAAWDRDDMERVQP